MANRASSGKRAACSLPSQPAKSRRAWAAAAAAVSTRSASRVPAARGPSVPARNSAPPLAAPTAIWRHRAGQGSSSSALARSRRPGAASSRAVASASRCSSGAKSRATSSRIDAGTAVAASNGVAAPRPLVLLGQQRLGDGGGEGVAVDRLLLVGGVTAVTRSTARPAAG